MEVEKLILITGSTGFIGSATATYLTGLRNRPVRGVFRSIRARGVQDGQDVMAGDLAARCSWKSELEGVRIIIHTAARVPSISERSESLLDEFRRTNVAGTLNLARQAADAGVRRFIFMSSVKVHGEKTAPRHPLTEDADYAPQDAYAISKMEAEQGLRLIATETAMEVVIIRAPLVYGPGVRANFMTLIRATASGLPLPLGAIRNSRSLIALDNLVDFIAVCLEHPSAANQTFLVSDGEDLSTPDLIRRIGSAVGRPVRLLPVPVALLRLGAMGLGKQDIFQRLCGNLQVDITKARQLLGWTPPITVDEGLHRAAGKTSLG